MPHYCQIFLDHSTDVNESLEIATFRASRSVQTSGKPPGGIYFIKSLATIPNLDKVVFKNQPFEDAIENFVADETTNFVACDIQLMHSQGIRSEIVEIYAQHVEDGSKTFWSKCYGHKEENFLNLPDFKSVNECLKQFFEVNTIYSVKSCQVVEANITNFYQLEHQICKIDGYKKCIISTLSYLICKIYSHITVN